MSNFTDFVDAKMVTTWIQDFAPEYVSCMNRTAVIKFVECAHNEVMGQWCVKMVFLVFSPSGDFLAKVVLPDMRTAKMSFVDGQLRPAHAKAVNCDNGPAIKALMAARYHIVRAIYAYDSYRTTGGWKKLMSPYVWKFTAAAKSMRQQYKVEERSVGSARSDDSAVRKKLATMASTLRTYGRRVRARFARRNSEPVADEVCIDEDVDLSGHCGDMPAVISEFRRNSDHESVRAGRNANARPTSVQKRLQKIEAKQRKKPVSVEEMRKKRLKAAMKPQGSTVSTVSNDVPCFQVVNSSIRHIFGYARIQIGGTVEAGFKGFYVNPTNIGHLKTRLRMHVEDLKYRGIRNILLSGTLWTDSCPLSGAVLNADLPKIFDGMNVKMIANARYGLRIASAAREHFGILETPHVDDKNVTYDVSELVDEENDIELAEYLESMNTMDIDVTDKPDLDLLTSIYEETFPNSSGVDQHIKQLEFHDGRTNIEMPEIKFNASPLEDFDERVTAETTYMAPTLRTHIEPRHPVNQTELMYSVNHRNYMPSKESSYLCSMNMATDLFETFLTCLKRTPERLQVSDVDISNYIRRKGEDLVRDIKRLMEELPQDLDRWDALVKGAAKPGLVDDADAAYSPTQVIVCKDKLYNVKFGPWFSAIKTRIMRDLNDDIFIFSESSIEGLQRRLTKQKHRMHGTRGEIDISKYDKSQGLTALLFDVMIMSAFGVPHELCLEWVASHIITRVKSMTSSTRFVLPVQRKSGDPWTYYGNTLYLMCVIKRSVSLLGGNLHYLMVSGDDSLYWCDLMKAQMNDIVDILARDYNLDAKLIRADSHYFCSRFMIEACNQIFLVPDPVKILVKFGKKDVRDRGHVEELRIALADQIDCYKYEQLREMTEAAAKDRYSAPLLSLAMEHMYAFTLNAQKFHSLYGDNEHAKRMVIIVPFDFDIQSSKRYVVHSDLVRRNLRGFDEPKLNAYMRSIGQNAGKRILITFKAAFVPQNAKVIADFSRYCDMELVLGVVRASYRD